MCQIEQWKQANQWFCSPHFDISMYRCSLYLICLSFFILIPWKSISQSKSKVHFCIWHKWQIHTKKFNMQCDYWFFGVVLLFLPDCNKLFMSSQTEFLYLFIDWSFFIIIIIFIKQHVGLVDFLLTVLSIKNWKCKPGILYWPRNSNKLSLET